MMGGCPAGAGSGAVHLEVAARLRGAAAGFNHHPGEGGGSKAGQEGQTNEG